ncbi:hypothetical protein [Flavobacterium sp.]|uniref:hypothetical protein n=1 Tax=Flavobacterium sp. TaxID=239 RepID=UPI00286B0C84|nr:hypothetical protein [Flavobacterium sp.]
MKRFLVILIGLIILNGCDDGNLNQESIDFEDVATQSCSTNNIIYKLKEKEALLILIPNSVFPSEPDITTINIDASNQVFYRFYDGKVTASSICDAVSPITPVAINQWTATSGKIQITTTLIKSTNTTENSTRITGYNHNIVFKDITFLKSDGTSQLNQTMIFGDYTTSATSLPVVFDKVLEKCVTNTPNQVYDYNSSESLTLNIDPALLNTTVLNTIKTGLITPTTNKFTYRLFSGLLTASYFCNATTPATPIISQEWIALSGVANTSGIIEVLTVSNGPGSFKHTITLKKVTLKNGNNDFSLGDNYLYGELLTN